MPQDFASFPSTGTRSESGEKNDQGSLVKGMSEVPDWSGSYKSTSSLKFQILQLPPFSLTITRCLVFIERTNLGRDDRAYNMKRGFNPARNYSESLLSLNPIRTIQE